MSKFYDDDDDYEYDEDEYDDDEDDDDDGDDITDSCDDDVDDDFDVFENLEHADTGQLQSRHEIILDIKQYLRKYQPMYKIVKKKDI